MNKAGALFFLATMLAGVSAQAQEAGLQNLNSCQDLAKLPAIRDADDKEHRAEADLRAAVSAVAKYEASCNAYAANPSQATDVTSRLGSEGMQAQTTSTAARTSSEAAISALQKAGPAARALGAGACAQEMENDVRDFRMHLNNLDGRLAKLANCAQPTGQGGGPQPGNGGGPRPGNGGGPTAR